MQDYFTKNIKEKLGSNKSFALTFCAFFALICIWALSRSNTVAASVSFIGILSFSYIGFYRPHYMRSANILWLMLGSFLGKVVSPVLMLLIYYVLVGMTGLVLKIARVDTLKLGHGQNVSSSWVNASKKVVNFTKQY